MKRLSGTILSLALSALALSLSHAASAGFVPAEPSGGGDAQYTNGGSTPSTQCSSNPYSGYGSGYYGSGYSGGYNPYATSSIADVEAIKHAISQVEMARAEFPELYKLDLTLSSKSNEGYLEWHQKNGSKATAILQDLNYARHLKTHNEVAGVLGKPKIIIAGDETFYPATTIFNNSNAAINEILYEVEAKKAVDQMITALKGAKLPHVFPLDLTKDKPFQAQRDAILQKYPDIYSIKLGQSIKTLRTLECADRLSGVFENAGFASDGSTDCEMPEEANAQIARFARQMTEALKSASSETPAAIAERESATLNTVTGYVQKSELVSIRARSGFRDCGLSDAEILAIRAYTGSLYSPVNQSLRVGSNEYKAVRDTMNAGLAKLKGYRGEVIRGTHYLGNDLEDLKQIGSVKRFKSFTSTTSSGPGFGGMYKFHIQSCNGKYIAPLSAVYTEEEVLFMADTDFRIVDVKDQTTDLIFKLEEICKE